MAEWYDTKDTVLDGLEKYPRVIWEKNIAEKILDLWSDEWMVNVIDKDNSSYGSISWSDDDHNGGVASHEIAINIARAVGAEPVFDTANDDQAEHFATLTLENLRRVREKGKLGD